MEIRSMQGEMRRARPGSTLAPGLAGEGFQQNTKQLNSRVPAGHTRPQKLQAGGVRAALTPGSSLPQALPERGSRKGSHSFSSTASRLAKKLWLPGQARVHLQLGALAVDLQRAPPARPASPPCVSCAHARISITQLLANCAALQLPTCGSALAGVQPARTANSLGPIQARSG